MRGDKKFPFSGAANHGRHVCRTEACRKARLGMSAVNTDRIWSSAAAGPAHSRYALPHSQMSQHPGNYLTISPPPPPPPPCRAGSLLTLLQQAGAGTYTDSVGPVAATHQNQSVRRLGSILVPAYNVWLCQLATSLATQTGRDY